MSKDTELDKVGVIKSISLPSTALTIRAKNALNNMARDKRSPSAVIGKFKNGPNIKAKRKAKVI